MFQMRKWVVVVVTLAVLVGMAAPVMAEETKGRLKSISTDKKEFTFLDKDTKEWTFQLGDDAKVTLIDKAVRLEDLKPGDEVTVIYEKKGNAFVAREIRCDKR